MGITPGGPTAASFMSYGLAKRLSRRKEGFGQGEPEGVVAPETADHAAGSSAILPMLALGVPGSATAAVMMGGLMIWGLNPGPMLFIERPDFVWGLIASMYLGNIVAVLMVLATIPLFASILRIPFAIIGPVIVLAMVLGDKAEDAFRQSMIMSRGSLSIFWSNGLVATLMLIGLALALGPLLSTVLGRLVKPKTSSAVA
jgi:TctA family transporter